MWLSGLVWSSLPTQDAFFFKKTSQPRPLLQHTGSRVPGLCSCGTWASLRHDMWDMSSLTSNQTHTRCFGRWILNHWTPRKVPQYAFYSDPQVQHLCKIHGFCLVSRISCDHIISHLWTDTKRKTEGKRPKRKEQTEVERYVHTRTERQTDSERGR